MKTFKNTIRRFSIIIPILVIVVSCSSGDDNNSVDPHTYTNYTGQYLGQTQPGNSAIQFLPAIFNNTHSTPVFSPDGNLVYWTAVQNDAGVIRFMEQINGRWTTNQNVKYISDSVNEDVPFFSADGNRLYFYAWFDRNSNRNGIYYVEKVGNNWSSPRSIGSSVNNMYMHWQFSVAANGNIYFAGSEDAEHDIWHIYKAEWQNGSYLAPVRLPQEINLINTPISYAYAQNCPLIAPDESYLIFGRYVDASLSNLFISYKDLNGRWSEAIDMGNRVNTNRDELCPVVTRDNRYLFFTRDDTIYWISTQIIEDLRPRN